MMLATLREVNHEMQRYSHRQLMLLIQNSLNKMAQANTTINSANSLLSTNQSSPKAPPTQPPTPCSIAIESPQLVEVESDPIDPIPILKSEPESQHMEIFEASASPISNQSRISNHSSVSNQSSGSNHSSISNHSAVQNQYSTQHPVNNFHPVQSRPFPVFPSFSGSFSGSVPLGNTQPMKTEFSDFQQYQLPSFYWAIIYTVLFKPRLTAQLDLQNVRSSILLSNFYLFWHVRAFFLFGILASQIFCALFYPDEKLSKFSSRKVIL